MIGRARRRHFFKRFATSWVVGLFAIAALILGQHTIADAAVLLASRSVSESDAAVHAYCASKSVATLSSAVSLTSIERTRTDARRPVIHAGLALSTLPDVVARVASYGADVRIRLLAFLLLGCVVVVPCWSLAERACRFLDLSPLYTFAIVGIALGIVAEATFFLTMVTTLGAKIVVWLLTIAGTLATLRTLRCVGIRRYVAHNDLWYPFALTALAGLSYAALLSLALPENLPISTATMEWLRLAVDNVIPHTLATNIAAHAPPEPFIPGWQSSDRPPLQAGFLLLFHALLPFDLADATAYQALSMLLQATVFGALFTLCRAVGAGTRRALGIVFLAWLSGFFFANTAFVWPKLLAATFLTFATALVLAGGTSRWPRFAVIGVGTALGLLAHGGVAFTVPMLVLAWLLRDGERAIRPLVIGGLALILTLAPWTWYQRGYDPPGDRLVKWHLAGQVSVSSEPFLPTLVHAYTAVPLMSLLQNRLTNVATLVGIDTVDRPLDAMPLQQRQFRILPYSLGVLGVPYLAALFLWRSRRPMLQAASRLAWIALGANLFWAVVMYNRSSTVVHLGSYFTVALMYIAAGLVATEWLPVWLFVALAQVVVFAIGWLPTFAFGGGLTPARSCDIVTLLGLGATTVVIARTQLRSTIRHVT